MPNSKDGKPPVTNTNKKQPSTDYTSVTIDIPPSKTVGFTGNHDAKILGNLYKQLSDDGLTGDDRKAIEHFDNILKGADIIISTSGDKATIVQEDGRTFDLKSSKPRTK